MTTRMTVLTLMLLAAALLRPPAPPPSRNRRRPRPAEAAPAPAPSVDEQHRARDPRAAAGDLRAVPAVGRPGAAPRPVAAEPKPDYLAPYPTLASFLRSIRRSRTTRCSSSAAHRRRPAVLRRPVAAMPTRSRTSSSASRSLIGVMIGIVTLAWLVRVRDRASPLAARDEDPDRGAHQDRRSARRRTRICSPTCSRRPASGS